MIFTHTGQSAQPAKPDCLDVYFTDSDLRKAAKQLGIGLAALMVTAASSPAFAANCFKEGNWRDAVDSDMETTVKVKAADPSDGWKAYKRFYIVSNKEENPMWDQENPDQGKTVGGSYMNLFNQKKLNVQAGKLKKNIFETWFVKDNLRIYCIFAIGTAGVGYKGQNSLDAMVADELQCEKNPSKTYNGNDITNEKYFSCNRNFNKKDNKFVFQFVLKDR